MLIKRAFNRVLSRLASSYPALSKRMVASFDPIESSSIPWCPVSKPLKQSRIALVTTAGVHHKSQPPFDMHDARGDPTFRILDARTIADDYRITHDYYDHRDADRDLNVVFPIHRLKEMQAAGLIGGVSDMHFSFMGHVTGHHIETLVGRSTPQIIEILKQSKVDAVLLTPA